MVSEREKYERFENYLKDSLDKEAKTAFENELRENDVFNREFEAYRQTHNLIFDGGLLDIRQELHALHTAQLKTGRSWRGIRNVLITAGILVTGVLLYIYLNRDDKTKPGKNIRNESGSRVESIAIPGGEESMQNPLPDSSTPNKGLNTTAAEGSGLKVADQIIQSPVSGTGTIKSTPLKGIAEIINPRLAGKEGEPLVLPSADTSRLRVRNLTGNESTGQVSAKDCQGVFITCEFMAENTCSDRSQGRILFLAQSLRGGTSPYEFSINGGKVFESRSLFDNLQGGIYQLLVRDARQCISEAAMAEVKAEECDDRFAPGLGELWEIPFISDKEGRLYIFSMEGKLLYSAGIGQSFARTWDGKSLNGEPLPLGVYLFRLEFHDGSRREGTVTVIK